MQSDILLNMDCQKVTQLVLVDLSAAFDTVDHTILCDIMRGVYGISDCALNWIGSYLQSRSQRIKIDNAVSKTFSLDYGVPQGSCLGPVMFTQYASSIFEVIENHSKNGHGYADDHQIYSGCNPLSIDTACESMENCIANISQWMQSMQLKF